MEPGGSGEFQRVGISGAVADRMEFTAWAIFAAVCMLLGVAPVSKRVYGGWVGAARA